MVDFNESSLFVVIYTLRQRLEAKRVAGLVSISAGLDDFALFIGIGLVLVVGLVGIFHARRASGSFVHGFLINYFLPGLPLDGLWERRELAVGGKRR